MQNRKGQWMLISAVVISTVFLLMSTTLLSYFGVESSKIAVHDEKFIYNNLDDKLTQIVETDQCVNMTRDLDNFIAFAKQEYGGQGYFIDIAYTNSCPSGPTKITKLAVSSDTINIVKTTTTI